jgi:glutamate---cysteine ligase / carboxylate-amine ligase
MALSFGVEEEFLLVHPTATRLLPRSAEVIDAAERMGVRLHKELTTAQIETNTPVCWTMNELRRELYHQRCAAASAADKVGVRLVAAGATLAGSPAAPLSDSPRYRRMAGEFGLLARSGVCGCHVHVGVADRETAVQVGNHVRPWLPTLLALTANSSVYCGQETGYASWRSVLLSRWPFSGPPPFLASADHYDSLVGMAVDSGAALDPGMVYWDIRPSEHAPTVEIRVSDVPSTVAETTLLASLVRGLVAAGVRALDGGRTGPPLPSEALRIAYWRSARDGLRGTALDPFTLRNTAGTTLLTALVRHIRDELEEWGELSEVRSLVGTVLARGNGAMRQHDALFRRGLVDDVVDQAASMTLR